MAEGKLRRMRDVESHKSKPGKYERTARKQALPLDLEQLEAELRAIQARKATEETE